MTFADAPTLENQWVRLERLDQRHAEDLATAAAEADLWRARYTWIPAPPDMSDAIEQRLARQRDGDMAPWAVIDAASGRAVGMTTYMNIVPAHRRVEIGSTWLAVAVQGTRVNPAAKLLLLERAFDTLDCLAVELRTHVANTQSRAAIAKLGATQDGILRRHMILADGSVRDTVVFSITADEWPDVRARLERRLEQ